MELPSLSNCPFGSLPPEIVHVIAEYLAIGNDHASVVNLAYAAKSLASLCLPLAKSIFFREIDIHVCYGFQEGTIDGNQKLRNRLEPVVEKIARASSFRYVRRIVFRVCTSAFSCDDWAPLVQFVQQLPALESFCYHPRTDLPLPVLEMLERYAPKCRLYVIPPLLRSMRHGQISDHDFRIVTSPSLHSTAFSFKHDDGQTFGHTTQQMGAMLRAVRLAPNLKHVNVDVNMYAERRTSVEVSTRVDVPHQRDRDEPLPVASLSRLRIKDKVTLKPGVLTTWATATNFAVLRALELDSVMTTEALDHWSLNLAFPALTSLRLELGPTQLFSRDGRHQRDLSRSQPAEFYRAARDFILALPPLRDLQLSGWHPGISTETVVRYHGQTLQRLMLSPHTWQLVSKEDILAIAQYCPVVEDLTITLPRSLGSHDEIALYQSLGKIRRLRHLNLTLDVSDITVYGEENADPAAPAPIDPSFDEFDRQQYDHASRAFYPLLNGHVKKLILNTVIDKDLTCAIFQHMQSKKNPGSCLLEKMKIDVTGRGELRNWSRPGRYDAFEKLVRRFSSSWTIERDQRYDHRDRVLITRVIDGGMYRIGESENDLRGFPLGTELDRIFYRIWPRDGREGPRLYASTETEEEDRQRVWVLYWKSHPLAVYAEGRSDCETEVREVEYDHHGVKLKKIRDWCDHI